MLRDPRAVELVDYPFGERFGAGHLGQWQAFRARRFDEQVQRFLTTHPDGQVVALGEGLETQFWPVDNGRVRWLTVEVADTAAVRSAAPSRAQPDRGVRADVPGRRAGVRRCADLVQLTPLKGRLKTTRGYRLPPMPWALDGPEKKRIRELPAVAELVDVSPPRGRGLLYGQVFPLLNHVAAVRPLGLSGLPVVRVRFAATA
jgi:hypothetical protein